MNFGIEFSELFLDSMEKAGDIQSKINLHNNNVGRIVRHVFLTFFLKTDFIPYFSGCRK